MTTIVSVPVIAELPPGFVFSVAGTVAPVGNFLYCNGQIINRATYADLFALIGEQYNVGDGVNTFGLPDYRGQFLRSIDDGAGIDPGRTIGTPQAGATGLGAVHPTVSVDTKTHTHTAVVTAAGGHGHQVQYFSGTSTNQTYARRGANTTGSDLQSTYAGSHNHTGVSATAADHVHLDLPLLPSATLETIPDNIAVQFWVSF